MASSVSQTSPASRNSWDQPSGVARGGRGVPDAPPGRGLPQLAGLMFWLTRKVLSGSYCALARASRS